jgi:hypothetical protein
MADANARKAMIKQATFQVRTGGAFIRRATATAKTRGAASVSTPAASVSTPKSRARPSEGRS